MKIIESNRLILRTWKKEDANPYFKFNQDSKVLEHLPRSMTLEEATALVDKTNSKQSEYGFCLWAVELKSTGEFIGFIGLNYTDWPAHFTPAVEVGWRLGSEFWGQGYATEGAKAALNFGFKKCGLKEIVSFTVPDNRRSIRVMEKIGLKRDIKGDFAHPKLDPTHRLSHHVLYRLNSDDFNLMNI